jgi:hypothetical protein
LTEESSLLSVVLQRLSMGITPKGSHMWRILLAGLGTSGGLALLFFGSFGDPSTIWRDLESAFSGNQTSVRPVVTQSPAFTAQGPEAQVGRVDDNVSQRQLDALRQLKRLEAGLALATQDTAVLRTQADQARQELDELHRQRAAEQAALEQTRAREQRESETRAQRAADTERQIAADQAALQQAKEEAQRETEARAQREAETKGQTAAQQAVVQQKQAEQAAAQQKQAEQVAAQQKQAEQARAQQKQAEQAVAQQKQAEQAAAQQKQAEQAAAQQKQAEQAAAQQRQAEQVAAQQKQAEQAAAQRTQTADARQEVKVLPPARPVVAAPSPTKPTQPSVKAAPSEQDAREAVLSRLRRGVESRPGAVQFASNASRPVASDASRPVASDAPRQLAPDAPPGPSPRQRLMDARTLLAAGRTDEAQRLLEQAQVQLVFRPVGPSQDASAGGSVAAGQVAEALSMLGAGDVLHAIRYINLAVAQADRGAAPATAVAPTPIVGVPQPMRNGGGYNYGR